MVAWRAGLGLALFVVASFQGCSDPVGEATEKVQLYAQGYGQSLQGEAAYAGFEEFVEKLSAGKWESSVGVVREARMSGPGEATIDAVIFAEVESDGAVFSPPSAAVRACARYTITRDEVIVANLPCPPDAPLSHDEVGLIDETVPAVP